MRLGLSVATLCLFGGGLAHAKNMNSRPYVIANGNPSAETQFSTDYTGAEFFDVYSQQISSQYAQVFWAAQDPVSLPPEIVERFHDKIIAITGYEVDQVMELEDGSEASVPITWAYNHHYMAFLVDEPSEDLIQEIKANYRNHAYRWVSEDDSDDPSKHNSQFFSEGNGGEFRSSYHGYPKGYAQLLHNPTHFVLTPMQIDTWNRTAMRDLERPLFHPGPLPKSSRIPPSAGYSGLIECPCSDRLDIEWWMSYSVNASQCEGGDIQNATECLEAAKKIVQSANYHLVNDTDEADPSSGCSLVPHTNRTVDVLWNSKMSHSAAHDASMIAFSNEQINMTVVLDKEGATIRMTGPADRWFGAAFGATTMCLHQKSEECPEGGPYGIVVLGDSVEERKLDQHGPGHVLDTSIQVVSNEIADNGNRTVVLTRPLQGLSEDHFTFDPTQVSLDIIAARGCGMVFAQHCGHGSTTLSFLQTNKQTSICRSGIEGTVGGLDFNNDRCTDEPTSDLKKQQNPTCTLQYYRGGQSCCHHLQSLLDKDQSIPWEDEQLEYRLKFRFYYEDYVPATDETPVSHLHLHRLYWQTEAWASEYDVPQCSKGTPPEQCVHTITSRFLVKDAVEGHLSPDKAGIKLIYAGPHCHAPTCLSMDLYNADTGELLCHAEPIHSSTGELYHETGFIAIPPCLWGSPEEGLVEPTFLSANTTLLSIKRSNSTLAHTGEMASWQMRAILIPREENIENDVVLMDEESMRADNNKVSKTKNLLRRADVDPDQ